MKKQEKQGKGFETFTVRHSATGLYLSARKRDVRIGASGQGDDGEPFDLALAWRDREDASIMTRWQAEAASTAYIALTGDHGIELEPVEEVAM